ncbi:pseudouridine synthase [Pontiella sp.]|uniref:pseudouridine synthase n=1 Tax=Pontiella sp. TaxID=2837462 RepID=UPI00356846D7
MTMEPQRLSKIMAQRGMCSRREADRYIEQGLVQVDGEAVSTLGMKVSPDAQIELASEGLKQQDRQVTILINKPIGYVSGQPEDGYKAAVSIIGNKSHWREDPSKRKFNFGQLKGLAPAGRLDIDSNGLLVLTQDGRIARQLIGEDSSVDKEYLVRVTGHLSEQGLKLLNHGLSLDGKKLKPAQVSWQNKDQLRFILREGKKRQIRRMCELVDLNVVGLKRIRIGKIVLGNLPDGQWRYLGENEKF